MQLSILLAGRYFHSADFLKLASELSMKILIEADDTNVILKEFLSHPKLLDIV